MSWRRALSRAHQFSTRAYGVNARILERVLLRRQEQVLGPVQDKLVILDGKKIRRKINPRSRATRAHPDTATNSTLPARSAASLRPGGAERQ